MGNPRPDNHAEGKDRRVHIAFTGEKQLSAGTTARHNKRQTGKSHAQEIPDMIGMGNWLTFKTRFELTKNQVHGKGKNQQGGHTADQMKILDQNNIPKRAHGAEAAALSKRANDQTGNQADENWGMLRAGSFQAEEYRSTRREGDLKH